RQPAADSRAGRRSKPAPVPRTASPVRQRSGVARPGGADPAVPAGAGNTPRGTSQRGRGKARPAEAGRDAAGKPRLAMSKSEQRQLLEQLDAVESGAGGGILALPGDRQIEVTNLRKVFWPARAGAGKM